MSSWVKLHRKILENIELMNDDNAFIVFSKLLLLANSKGEIGLSTRKIATKVHMNYSTLRKVLARLERYGMLQIGTQFGTHQYTVIRICKWNTYQSTGTHFGTHSGRRADAERTQLTGVSRIENKNIEKGSNKIDDFRGAKSPAKEKVREMLREKGIIK